MGGLKMENKQQVIKLIRHGESLKVFPGSEQLTLEQMEWRRPLSEEANQSAAQLGKVIEKFCFKNLIPNYDPFNDFIDYEPTIIDYISTDLVHSGRARSKQTLQAIMNGLGFDINRFDNITREEFDLGYIFDPRYEKAIKQAAKSGEFPTTIDFLLAVSPEQFFKAQGITDASRTYSAEQIQKNMRGILRRAVERSTFTGDKLGVYVGHEPVLSLCMVDLTDKPITEVGGKFKELESVSFTAHREKGLPTTILNLRGQEYDVSSKLY
jgi:broad specificity phosphatase PhoE